MLDLPEYLKAGEVARLIPVGSSSQRERYGCSVLLASLRVVQPFARAFFDHMDWRIGSWPQILGYTEPVFKNQPDDSKCRPDGLLILETGRRQRRVLVETKIGLSKIDTDQLAQYCRLAKANKIDAIVTVSNELTSDPTQLPYEAPKEARSIPIFHWSWSSLVTLAELVLEVEENFDQEQDYILREIIRYFDHESAGVSCNTQMCTDWPNVIERVQHGARLSSNDSDILNVVQCWHQQLAGICLSLTRRLKFPVTIKLSRRQRDQRTRLAEDVSDFVASSKLFGTIEFEAQASPLYLEADVTRRAITCRVSVDAPLDRQRYGSRARWLLKQLPADISIPVKIEIVWERNHRTYVPLVDLRADLDSGRIDSVSSPRAFEIIYVADQTSKFAGVRTFVPVLEETITQFHDSVVRHIRPWIPRDSDPHDDRVVSVESPEEPPEEANVIANSRKVMRTGELDGSFYSIFDDGSIEIETGTGIQRFKDFAELSAAAAAKNGSGLRSDGHAEPI